MAFYVVQFLTGLASAASLFLVASGLSIIFGVTRIVNFAHGAFYMLGAYMAFTLTERFSGAAGFWGGILVASLIVAILANSLTVVLITSMPRASLAFSSMKASMNLSPNRSWARHKAAVVFPLPGGPAKRQ